MQIRKFILSLVAMIAAFPLAGNAKPQDEIYIAYLKNEIYIQYGTPSIIEIANKKGGDISRSGGSYSGIAAVGYNRYLNPYFCIGGYFGAGNSKANAKNADTGKLIYTNQVQSITGMVDFGWSYFRNGIWEISCGASAGLTHKKESITPIDKNNKNIPQERDRLAFAYNLTVARVRIGGGIIGGFAELGFGYKGIANAGLSIRF